jgi:hypothetical protein
MEEIMQWAFSNTQNEPAQPWTRRVVLVSQFSARRSKRAPEAVTTDVVVTRVVSAARLDPTMRQQLARVLAVTVDDWLQTSQSKKTK